MLPFDIQLAARLAGRIGRIYAEMRGPQLARSDAAAAGGTATITHAPARSEVFNLNLTPAPAWSRGAEGAGVGSEVKIKFHRGEPDREGTSGSSAPIITPAAALALTQSLPLTPTLPATFSGTGALRFWPPGATGVWLDVRGTDTQVLVERQADGRWWVLFPGSVSVHDWITNLRFVRMPWVTGKIHGGFRAAFFSVLGPLFARIPAEAELVFAGHSLGGALAMLAAHYASENKFHVSEVYTFGQPRVGNAEFARAYDAALGGMTFRVQNHRDPVPRAPWFLGLYRHAGTQVYLDKHAELHVAAPVRRVVEDLTEGCRAWAVEESGGRGLAARLAAYHGVAAYQRKLEVLG